MRSLTLPLTLIAALTFFVGLGRGAITDADEAFYAEAAREMVESGDWLTPHYNYEPRFQKPVLYYWLTAATYAVAGPSETGARLWAALSGLGLALVTAACARRWYDETTALVAGAIVATSFGYFTMARSALPDLPLTLCITAAIWAAFMATLEQERRPRGWVLLSAAAIGCGLLMKGPVGLLIPAIVVGPLLLIERRSLSLRWTDIALGALAALLIAVPWYVAMWWTHGASYLEGFFIGDNLERFATSRFNDPRPWWFYGPVIAGGLLPWTPLACVWLRPLRLFLARRSDVGTLEVRLLAWAIVPLLFYTASVGKQPRYILPVLPPLAILLGASLVERTRAWRGVDGTRMAPRRDGAVVVGGVLSGGILAVLAYLVYRVQPLLVQVSDTYTTVAACLIGACGLAVVGVSLSRRWRAIPAAVAIAAAISLPALQLGVLAASTDDVVQQVARVIAAERQAHEPVASYRVLVRNLVYYTGVKQVDLVSADQFRTFLNAPTRVLAVAPADAVDELEASGTTLHRLAELPY